MNIGGNLSMSAGNDFVAQGTQINAAGGVNITAGNDATITTAQKGSYYESVSTEKKSTWWGLGSRTTTITHTNTDLTNTAANINGAGGGGVNINAGNDTTVIGANINGAGGVNIHGGNNTNILAAYDIKEKIDTKTVTSNDFGRFMDTLKQSATNPHITPIHTPTDTYNNNIDSTRTAVLTNINGGSGNVSLTAGNTLNLQAPVINGGSFTYGGGNQTNLLAAIDSREISNTSGGRNFHWQINQSQGSKTETLHMTQVNVPVGMTNYVGAGGISVQLPKGSSLATQIETLSKLPGNEYLVDLANRKDIDWQQVDVINKTWDHKKEGLTQEAAIIVAIVVTIFTAGAASSAGVAAAEGAGFATATTAASTTVMATAGGTAFAAATAAAVTTLATQATIALINSQGDIGAALQEMASEQNLKVLATSVITAGLVQGLGSAFNLPTGTGTSTTLIDKLQTNMVNGVASSLVSTAINGGSLEDNLKAALKNAVITSVAAQGAGMIGDANLDIFSSTLAHAILGCAIGTATTGQATGSGGGCAAGAGGAVVGELAANWYGANVAGATTEDIANFAKLATALVAAGGGAAAMNLAGMTSNNAVVNNYLTHAQIDQLEKELKACKDKDCDNQDIAVIKKRYEDISKANDIALKTECQKNSTSSICAAMVKEALNYAGDNGDTTAIKSLMAQDILRSRAVVLDQIFRGNSYDILKNTDIETRADFFGAMAEVTKAQWFGAAEQTSREDLQGIGFNAMALLFALDNLSNPTLLNQWRQAGGNTVMIAGQANFTEAYSNQNIDPAKWTYDQLVQEQKALQPIYDNYLSDPRNNANVTIMNAFILAQNPSLGFNFTILNQGDRVKIGCLRIKIVCP